MDSRPNHVDGAVRQALKGHEMTPDPQVWNSLEKDLGAISKPKAAGWKKMLPLSLILLVAASGAYFSNLAVLSDGYLAQSSEEDEVGLESVASLEMASDKKSAHFKAEKGIATNGSNLRVNGGNSIKSEQPKKKEGFSDGGFEDLEGSSQLSDEVVLIVESSGENSDALSDTGLHSQPESLEVLEQQASTIGSIDMLKKEILDTEIMNSDQIHVPLAHFASANGPLSRLSIGGFFSSDWSYRTVTIDDGQRRQDLDARESAKVISTVGLTMEYQLTRRLSLMSGALVNDKGILHSSERKFSDNTEEEPEQDGQSNGQATLIDDRFLFEMDNLGKDTASVAVSGNYTYRYLEVPLMVKFSFPVNKFNIYAAAGLSASFLLAKQAVVQYARDGRFVEEQVELTSPINSVLLGSNAMIGLEYQFADGWYAGVAPNVRYSFTPVTNNKDMRVNPYSIGAAFTFRKRL